MAPQWQLQGEALFSVLKKGNSMWGIGWGSSGRWVSAVVCFRNVCLTSDLEVWDSQSTQPPLCLLIKKRKSLSSVSHHELSTFAVHKSLLIKSKGEGGESIVMGANLKQIWRLSRRKNSV